MAGLVGLGERQPWASKLLAATLKAAQARAERRHSEARRHLFEYDQVRHGRSEAHALLGASAGGGRCCSHLARAARSVLGTEGVLSLALITGREPAEGEAVRPASPGAGGT